jgi:hypothetical protein
MSGLNSKSIFVLIKSTKPIKKARGWPDFNFSKSAKNASHFSP